MQSGVKSYNTDPLNVVINFWNRWVKGSGIYTSALFNNKVTSKLEVFNMKLLLRIVKYFNLLLLVILFLKDQVFYHTMLVFEALKSTLRFALL